MLLTVGGLMASLVLPGQAVPALAFAATATAVSSVRRVISARRGNRPSANGTPGSVTGAPTFGATEDSSDDAVTLQWRDVSCSLLSKGDAPSRAILSGVSGSAKPGRILAILGPSGSGKTTMLNALAGRVPASSSIALSGTVLLNGVPISKCKQPVAYVTQEDIFFSQLTIRETLDVAARLRLPAVTSKETRDELVNSLVRKLGLLPAFDSRVGDEKTRGISGGEKKRLSLACELLSTPRLVMCDEPTSGLDAFQAESVMVTLQALAKAGHTVVCSIHQPSSTVFKMCDDIVLLASGRPVYAGAALDAPAHFTAAGYDMPEQCNPAERYLDIISIDYTSEETEAASKERIDKLIKAFAAKDATPEGAADGNGLVGMASDSSDGDSSSLVVGKRCVGGGFVSNIGVLFVRAWRQFTRDKKTNMSRLMTSISSALLFGSIYWRIGSTQTTIQDRLGLLQVCTINTAMSSLVKTLNVFPRERVLVNRERARGSYSVFEYFSSKLFAEMPVSAFFPLVFSTMVYPMVRLAGGAGRITRFMGIITLESFTAASYGLMVGALVPSTEIALAVGPATFVLQIVFGGLYITERNVPRWASWVPRVSLIKHAYEGLCVNEFRGLEFETQRPWDVRKGEQVLQRLTWGESTVAKTCLSQAKVLAFNYLATYGLLLIKKPAFAKMKPAVVEVVNDGKNAETGDMTVTSDGKEGPVEGNEGTVNGSKVANAATGQPATATGKADEVAT